MKSLKQQVEKYREVLQNTISYRQAWNAELKVSVKQTLEKIIRETGLKAEVIEKNEFENLEAVALTLGQADSGIYELLELGAKRSFVKDLGLLVFQQLYNGKIIVMVNYPSIDTYGEPNPPKTLAIYRPEELSEGVIINCVEDFLTEILTWEDIDDTETGNRIGFTWSRPPSEQQG